MRYWIGRKVSQVAGSSRMAQGSVAGFRIHRVYGVRGRRVVSFHPQLKSRLSAVVIESAERSRVGRSMLSRLIAYFRLLLPFALTHTSSFLYYDVFLCDARSSQHAARRRALAGRQRS